MGESKYHPNHETPKLGAKIEYALKFNDVNVAVYGELDKIEIDLEYTGVGLSDFTDWSDVLIWKYIDENYNYGLPNKE